jgi:SSS family solute:Na+ symporter
MAEGKGGWISPVHTFPSTMAQNFWIAIFAWSSCFVVTILVSLMTPAKPETELRGLVYGLTDVPSDVGEPWYRRPLVLAGIVCVVLVILNVTFW